MEPIDRQYVENLLRASVPERLDDMREIWRKYDPQFFIAQDDEGVRMSANAERVVFDHKTLCVYWMLSFAGWRALECYCPAVYGCLPAATLAHALNLDEQLVAASFPVGTTIADVLSNDPGLILVESQLNEDIYAARSMLRAKYKDVTAWPCGIPHIASNRESLANERETAIFDLACMSTAYAFCHEIRHVMYAKEKNAPPSRPEEELACDVWAREFLTAKLNEYAVVASVDYKTVLAKRSMAAAIGIFVLYESSERHGDAGTEAYPPIADRMEATLHNTPLLPTDYFWVLYASVLVAILRRRNKSPSIKAENAQKLCELLVEEIRQTS